MRLCDSKGLASEGAVLSKKGGVNGIRHMFHFFILTGFAVFLALLPFLGV